MHPDHRSFLQRRDDQIVARELLRHLRSTLPMPVTHLPQGHFAITLVHGKPVITNALLSKVTGEAEPAEIVLLTDPDNAFHWRCLYAERPSGAEKEPLTRIDRAMMGLIDASNEEFEKAGKYVFFRDRSFVIGMASSVHYSMSLAVAGKGPREVVGAGFINIHKGIVSLSGTSEGLSMGPRMDRFDTAEIAKHFGLARVPTAMDNDFVE